MKILYDNIIFGGQKTGGISVVWYELVSRALRDSLDVSFIDFPDNHNLMREKLGNLPAVIRSVPSKYKKYFKYLPVFFHSKENFIFHSSFFRYCPFPYAVNVTTVHDFTNELFQTGQGPRKERWIKDNAINHSDFIACISEHTKRDFQRFYPSFPLDRIKVIYNGVSDDYYQSDSLEWPFEFKKKGFLLFVGERSGYKNFNLVLDALEFVELDLVIAGMPLTQVEKEKLSHIKGKYHYVGRLSSDKLNVLYNNAFALAYPSLYEGFGLPVIEAQKAGCPVIAARTSSIPEVIGDTPLLMDEVSVDSFLNKICILRNIELRDTIVNRGLENASRFSWETTYRSYLSLYEYALSTGKRGRR